MPSSNCCGSDMSGWWLETSVCPDCKEHCGIINNEVDYMSNRDVIYQLESVIQGLDYLNQEGVLFDDYEVRKLGDLIKTAHDIVEDLETYKKHFDRLEKLRTRQD